MKRIILVSSLLLVVACAFYLFLIKSSLSPNDENISGAGKTLVILLHGYTLDSQSLSSVENALKEIESFRDAEFLNPDLPLNTLSMASMDEVAAEMLVSIDALWNKSAADGDPYQNIVFVGHSAGALLARKIYVIAHGETIAVPFEKIFRDAAGLIDEGGLIPRRPWADKVSRIVLLAGMNRGWSISHHMSLSRSVQMQLGVAVSYVLELFYQRPPFIMQLRRGAPFITQLRLQWLAMEQSTHKNTVSPSRLPVVVQLLGTIDDLVSPDDNLDLAVGHQFHYLSVPYSGHRNVIEMDENQVYGTERKKAFVKAMTLQGETTDALDFGEQTIFQKPAVSDVVFVVHGIRDQGYWTKQIAWRTQQQFRNQDKDSLIAAQTSSYGYFPMLSFLTPGKRQEKVEWFMDQYVRAKALYPQANFHFIGHSHGTYLLAKAMQDYPAVRFKHVVFAGSVVHKDYDWGQLLKDKRVEGVLNYVATADWVVAFFPNAFQIMGWQDLGSAGHDGFIDNAVTKPEKFVVGGHSAALHENMWDAAANFVVTGRFVEHRINAPLEESFENQMWSEKRSLWVVYPAYGAPLILVLIFLTLFTIGHWLYRLPVREWKKTLLLCGYLFLIWTILTKV